MMVEMTMISLRIIPCREWGKDSRQPSAKTALVRLRLIEQLMREIMNYDTEFRREDAAGAIGSHSRH